MNNMNMFLVRFYHTDLTYYFLWYTLLHWNLVSSLQFFNEKFSFLLILLLINIHKICPHSYLFHTLYFVMNYYLRSIFRTICLSIKYVTSFLWSLLKVVVILMSTPFYALLKQLFSHIIRIVWLQLINLLFSSFNQKCQYCFDLHE